MIITQNPVRGSDLIRDFLLEQGVPTARMRKKQLFTPYEQRIRLMRENQDKPEEFRAHSLRRKLTKLDRALSDEEAYALDRAFNAWLSLNGKSKSVDPGAIHGGGSYGEPLTQMEIGEARAFGSMRKRLKPHMHNAVRILFRAMAPWEDQIYKIEISQVIELAKALKAAYEQK